jgi:hypothetical protein
MAKPSALSSLSFLPRGRYGMVTVARTVLCCYRVLYAVTVWSLEEQLLLSCRLSVASLPSFCGCFVLGVSRGLSACLSLREKMMLHDIYDHLHRQKIYCIRQLKFCKLYNIIVALSTIDLQAAGPSHYLR